MELLNNFQTCCYFMITYCVKSTDCTNNTFTRTVSHSFIIIYFNFFILNLIFILILKTCEDYFANTCRQYQ